MRRQSGGLVHNQRPHTREHRLVSVARMSTMIFLISMARIQCAAGCKGAPPTLPASSYFEVSRFVADGSEDRRGLQDNDPVLPLPRMASSGPRDSTASDSLEQAFRNVIHPVAAQE